MRSIVTEHCNNSLLPHIKLHPTRRNLPMYIVAPSKEWHYLGFYFDPLLSFSSHCHCYASKALVVTNNLRILGHSLEGVDPSIRKHVYQAVVWSILSYSLPLWYHLNGKGCKGHVKLLTKTQNVALRWISGAFWTTPIPWMELVSGIAPVEQWANYTIWNALQWGSKLDHVHILNVIACSAHLHPASPRNHVSQCPPGDNIAIIK